MKHESNEFLAVTGKGLKSADFKSGFWMDDNQNLDAPAFIPSGATIGNNSVILFASSRMKVD